MFHCKCPPVFVLCFTAVFVNGQSTLPNCQDSASASGEIIVTALDEHDDKLQSMYKNLSSAIEQLARNQKENGQNCRQIDQRLSAQIDEKLDLLLEILQPTLLNQSIKVDANFETLQSANDKIIAQVMEHDRRLQMMQQNCSSTIEKPTEKLNVEPDYINGSLEIFETQDYCRGNSELCDCSTIKANGYTTNGVYRIYVVNENQRHYANVYCDMTTSNGAWTIFQRRKDGSEDFYRGWNDYANGFGDPNGEYWLGNDLIHLLTSNRRYRLRVDLEDFEGNKTYAEYSTFNISSAADKYRLSIGNYSGTAGNSFGWQHKDQPFSTKDADNDKGSSGNCAVLYRSAWWYHSGHASNLNGIYKRGYYSLSDPDCTGCGIAWYYWRGSLYSLKTTEMKISPVA